ncbi:MAG: hypothetical protein ACI9IT_002547 [Glaciecola sp.]|jgi:hypothetical protein
MLMITNVALRLITLYFKNNKEEIMYDIIIQLSQRLLLIKQKESIQVCNFKDNYYGDQQCCAVEQINLSSKPRS